MYGTKLIVDCCTHIQTYKYKIQKWKQTCKNNLYKCQFATLHLCHYSALGYPSSHLWAASFTCCVFICFPLGEWLPWTCSTGVWSWLYMCAGAAWSVIGALHKLVTGECSPGEPLGSARRTPQAAEVGNPALHLGFVAHQRRHSDRRLSLSLLFLFYIFFSINNN